MARNVLLSQTIYSMSSLQLGMSAFAGLCDFDVKPDGPDQRVNISPRPGTPKEVADEFLSYVLLASIESELSKAGQ